MTNIEMRTMEAVQSIDRKMRNQNGIAWEQRRYETARDILAAVCANPNVKATLTYSEMAARAVGLADALIERLRNDG